MNSNLPKTKEEIIKIIQHYGVKDISDNRISSLLSDQQLVENTTKGWKLTPSGQKDILKRFNISTDFDNNSKEIEFKNLLHPLIKEHAIPSFQSGDYRNAVLTSMTALSHQIRKKTGLKEDGDKLFNTVFSPTHPYLVFSDLDNEDVQKGFLLIFKGAQMGIRNPNAHSLEHDLTLEKAAQHMVFASLLARMIDEATLKHNE